MDAMTSSRPIRRVLVGTDFSPSCENATLRAIELAQAHQASLCIAHVLSLNEGVPWSFLDLEKQHSETVRAHAAAELERLIGKASERLSQVDSCILEGSPARALSAEAHRIGADLLVVGFKGDRPSYDDLVGSVPDQLIGATPCDLLVVKKPVSGTYRRVAACVDLEPGSEAVVTAATSIVPGAMLHVVHCHEAPYERVLMRSGVEPDVIARHADHARRESLRRMQGLADQVTGGAAPMLILREGAPWEVIPMVVEEQRCDLAVLATHASLMRRLFIQSVSSQIGSRLNGDLYFIRPRG